MSIAERIHQVLQSILLVLLAAILLVGSNPVVPEKTSDQVHRYTRLVEFDYLDWTLEALSGKLVQASIGTPRLFSQNSGHQVVVDYLRLIDEILQAEYQLSLVYTDPAVTDPETESTSIRAHLDKVYTRQDSLAPLAEAILQAQIGTILADLDLAFAGAPFPPVLFHISPLPYHLVISPRTTIQQDLAVSLLPDLSVDRQAALEETVAAGLDVSALVVPVGGIGNYPTMVMRSTSLTWLADTIAHEWIHNWLTLKPLGSNYSTSPELRTMNETTASIAGAEIARIFLQRFYPELAKVYAGQLINLSSNPIPPGGWSPPVFDFRQEMHTTRIHVDELLLEGKVEEAEAYMEVRRQVFWDNGYLIRKLNQAYFAFYGAYADSPGGAAGEDPVGPAVRLLREQSGSLAEFLKTMAGMSNLLGIAESCLSMKNNIFPATRISPVLMLMLIPVGFLFPLTCRINHTCFTAHANAGKNGVHHPALPGGCKRNHVRICG